MEHQVTPVTVPEGTVHVTIEPAREERYSTGWRNETREYWPVLSLSTDPDLDTEGYVRVRGRRYRIRHDKARRPGVGWVHYYAPYGGAYQRDTGTEVEYKSSIYTRLREIEEAAIAAFTLEVPDWETRSIRLAKQAAIRRVQDKLDRMEQDRAHHHAALESLKADLAAFDAGRVTE